MFEEDEWFQLVQRLIKLTASETTKWLKVDDLYVAEIGKYAYRLWSADNDDRQPYVLAVGEMWGDEIDRVESGSINDNYNLSEALIELFRVVRRMVSGGPQLYSALLADLNEILPPEPPQRDVWSTETPF